MEREVAIDALAVRRCACASVRAAAAPSRPAVRALCLLAGVGIWLVLIPGTALASAASFTWAGRSTTSEAWSADANWEGGTAPAPGEQIARLTFPRLTGKACEDEQEIHPCYFSLNDVGGLTVESMQLYDGEDYFIVGEELGLGSGGLTSSSDGGSEPAGAFMLMPLRLDASQRWGLADRDGGGIEENGLLLAGDVTGTSSTLTIQQSNGSALILDNNTEIGPLTIEATSSAPEHIENGSVFLEGGELNFADRQPVDLRRIYFAGSGEVGPLTTEEATLVVGGGQQSSEDTATGSVRTSSVKLGSSSGVIFQITGSGTTADQEYSQLVAEGPIDLGGAIVVEVAPPPGKKNATCPVLKPGATYTFITTGQALSGTFSNAPEGGPEIPIDVGLNCTQTSQKMRIDYHKSGGIETVTGTVEAAATERQEKTEISRIITEELKEIAVKHEQEEEEVKRREAKEKTEKEEARRREEEAAAIAAKKHQEEEAAKTSVLGVREVSPDATIATTSLRVGASGTFSVRIKCPGGEASCAGTITLRTLHAVSVSASGHDGKSKDEIVTLASGSFTVAGGQTKAITLHLSATGRKLLGHSHLLGARATIVAHNPAGGTHTGQAIVTLRQQKPKRH